MGFYGLEKARWDATPIEVKRKALGEHPPLPREPIILDPKGNDSTKDAKSIDEKSTE